MVKKKNIYAKIGDAIIGWQIFLENAEERCNDMNQYDHWFSYAYLFYIYLKAEAQHLSMGKTVIRKEL